MITNINNDHFASLNSIKSKVSIVIPVANMFGKLDVLHELVRELLSQRIQVILVHDFYDKGTSNDLHKIEIDLRSIGNLTLIEGEFGGPGEARNAGKELTTGEYIAFWDSDDSANVANFVEFLNDTVSNGSDIGVAEFIVKNGEEVSKKINLGNTFDGSYRIISLNPGIWRFIFKKELISNLPFENFRMGEDQLFIANAVLNAKKINIFNKPVYNYQISHEGQLTKDPKNLVDIVKSLESLSILHLSSPDKTKSKFISLMYWKMYLTLLTRKNASISIIDKAEVLRALIRKNPKLFRLFCGQFFVKRNYSPLV